MRRPRAVSSRPVRRSPGAAGLLQVGVVGFGYWGPNVARNFQEAPGTRLVAISDLRPERLAQARDRFPEARVTPDFRELLVDPEVDAVVVATPVSTHYSLALAALQAGKHVLVEKPLARTSQQARELIDTAERLGRTLMVDHTFVYTGAVQKIKELVDSGQLGRLYYYDSVRINLGLFQHDISVIWDLAVHDLAIMDYVLDRVPRAAAAIGVAHIPGRPVNMGYLTCFFDDDLIAHLHVNWLAPVKVRRTLITGDRQMIVYDDVEPSEKIKVYDKGITVSNGLGNGLEKAHELLVGYRAGDMMAPQISLAEALRVEAQHFAECVATGRRPLTDGWAGLRVIQVLEAAERSLAVNGTPVELA
jgi:predicted dehydrogenase